MTGVLPENQALQLLCVPDILDRLSSVELLTLLGYLTQQLKKRMPSEFSNAHDVIFKYILKGQSLEVADIDYLEGISIVCDDLIWGTSDISAPQQYSSSVEIKDRIKELITCWLPF